MIEEFFNKNVPNNCKIAIYGAGTIGKFFKKYLEKNRTDVKIVYFFDSFVSGKVDEIEIKNPKELETLKDSFDLLVLSTRRSAHVLTEIFDFLGIPFIVEPREIELKIRIGENCLKRQKQAAAVFSDEEDKRLYNMLWKIRTGERLYTELENYVFVKHGLSKFQPLRNYNKQYLEFIQKDKIKTVFDAGYCNGIHSLAFKKHMKNLKNLYAFEPMYEKFKEEDIDFYIQKANFAKILPYGLWNEVKELEFCENTTAKYASRVKEIKNTPPGKSEVVIKINTTTIDETKKKLNIEKVDFIKMDIEGSELPALKGGAQTLVKDRPQLAISIYHSADDFVEIPLYLNNLLTDYTFHIGQYSFDLGETVLYGIPDELLK